MSDLLQAALEYEAKGFHVIPCNGKVPLVEWKIFQDFRPSTNDVISWWAKWPDANVAIVLGRGTFALDVDGPEGHDALRKAGVVIPPETPTSMTGKGVHYLFRGDQNDRVGLLPKVDVRGRGIIVVPPSIHPSGRRYTWLVPPGNAAEGLQEPPGALRRLLEAPPRVEIASGGLSGPTWLSEALAGVGEGVRNATCTRLAGYFLGKGTPKEAVVQLLLAWADKCSPRFPTNEVIACVESIADREGVHDDDPKSLSDDLMTVNDLYEKVATEHSWVVQDYIPRGALVLFSSEEKVGKSTLTYAMLSAIAREKEFLGRAVTRVPMLMLAVEEHPVDMKMRARRFGMTPDDPIWFYTGDLKNDDETMRDLRETVVSRRIGLVVLDTLGHQLSGELESENDNSGALKAMKPWLKLARETNAAVLLIHHTGKSGAMYRGASSFGGIVDQILAMRHAGGNIREIEARGRYWETPKSLRIALEGNQYRVVF